MTLNLEKYHRALAARPGPHNPDGTPIQTMAEPAHGATDGEEECPTTGTRHGYAWSIRQCGGVWLGSISTPTGETLEVRGATALEAKLAAAVEIERRRRDEERRRRERVAAQEPYEGAAET